MIKTLAGYVKEYKKASILTPIFMILEVVAETLIPLLMASIINEGIEALSGAGNQLQNLDIKKLNSVIESLGTVTAQLEKTTGTISRIFGK